LGELLIDMLPSELGRRLAEVSAFYPEPGGALANVAVAAARLGAESAFIGRVGDGAFGHHLSEVLRAEGVDTSGMRLDQEARTTMGFIAQPDENTVEFVLYGNPGADMRPRPVDVLKVNEVELALLTAAYGPGGARRPAVPPLGRLAHDVSALTRGGQSLFAMGPRLCVVTLGREGSFSPDEARW